MGYTHLYSAFCCPFEIMSIVVAVLVLEYNFYYVLVLEYNIDNFDLHKR